MRTSGLAASIAFLAGTLAFIAPQEEPKKSDDRPFTELFSEDPKDLGPTGSNAYFILEPGWELELKGTEKGKEAAITISVTDETKVIDGVTCRVVVEKEVVGGELEEITRDYFAISKRTGNAYYFGEDVDVYEDGKVVKHEGAWLAGEKGARWGLMMPAVPLLGARYQQEVAPGVAMDRGEIVGVGEIFQCPAGSFEKVLKIRETNPLEPGESEHKYYAPGVGVLKDGGLSLVRYGKAKK